MVQSRLACTQPSLPYVKPGAQKTKENRGPNFGSKYKFWSKVSSEVPKLIKKTTTQHRGGEHTTPSPLLGYHFGPLFGTQDFFFGRTHLFEGSSFGFRFGVRFGTHFVTENSLKRRPKRQEKEQKAREAKMWFGYGRRYTGGI